MSIFDNATQVMIGNKEVQSIITSNGGVLYEKQSGDNYLLTLTSDKDILSYYDNESALLTATLTNNGVGVQGEMVRFDGFLLDTPITRSITQNTETQVGSKYIVNNIPITDLNKIFLNKEHTVYITKDAVDGVKIHWPNGGSGDETSNISVENGIITYSRGGTTYTEDCSSYDMGVVYSQVSGFSINDYGVFAVTDSSGVATVSYESKGTGDLNIKCSCPGRMLVTEIYVEDCTYYITGINSNVNDWIKTGDISVISDSNGVTITESGSTERLALLPITVTGDNVFEIEYVTGYKKPLGIGLYQPDNYSEIGWVSVTEFSTNIFSHMGSSSVYPSTHKQLLIGDKLRICYEEGYLKSYVNDELIESVSKSLSEFKCAFYSRRSWSQTVKNIKIKPL